MHYQREPDVLKRRKEYAQTPKGKLSIKETLIKYMKKPDAKEIIKKAQQKYMSKPEIKKALADNSRKRRATKKEVFVESVNSQKVFERDKWICHICKEKIDKKLKFPSHFSASIDHVIPISKGGAHSYENIRAAHYICNLRKSAKVYA